MGRLLRKLRERFGDDDSQSDGETFDEDADILSSDVAKAVYEELRNEHVNDHHKTWNISRGNVVGEMDQTPKGEFANEEDPSEGHSDWFPEKLGAIIARTKIWCDVMSLGPPDGKFMEEFQKALVTVNENSDPERPVIIRMLFGNIIGMPVNCTKVLEEMTSLLPEEPNILLWVGSWRKSVSWNHAKIIAVDGETCWTGGHNLWDRHYLKNAPVHDLSFELSGHVAHDAHMYANRHWNYVKKRQRRIVGRIVNKLPDKLPTICRIRVTVTQFPHDEAGEFPPPYKIRRMPEYDNAGDIAVITVGRYGKIRHKDEEASDAAFRTMLNNAKTIIRLGIQDLGPVCIPGTKMALPGCNWPHDYLDILGSAIYERGVDVEIVLSNPGSIPGGLSGTEANYGNGWSCVDVCAEIIKSIQKKYDESDERLREMIQQNLRVCVLRKAHGHTYSDGMTIGMHAKHFIVDDEVAYVGSQNFYVCDLAEWGVIVDDKATTEALKAEYWDPMWEQSYRGGVDVDVDEVMDGLNVDRDGDPNPSEADQAFAALHLTPHAAGDNYDDNDSGSDYDDDDDED